MVNTARSGSFAPFGSDKICQRTKAKPSLISNSLLFGFASHEKCRSNFTAISQVRREAKSDSRAKTDGGTNERGKRQECWFLALKMDKTVSKLSLRRSVLRNLGGLARGFFLFNDLTFRVGWVAVESVLGKFEHLAEKAQAFARKHWQRA